MIPAVRSILACLGIGSLLFGCAAGGEPGSGAMIYERYCATCHQQDGTGVEGAFPPLVDSEWVSGDEGRLIRLVLRGMQGPIEVNGVAYNNIMTPHGFLNDAQVAAVLSYVRDRFGEGASPVDSAVVALVRAESGKGPIYVASELEELTGIPGEE